MAQQTDICSPLGKLTGRTSCCTSQETKQSKKSVSISCLQGLLTYFDYFWGRGIAGQHFLSVQMPLRCTFTSIIGNHAYLNILRKLPFFQIKSIQNMPKAFSRIKQSKVAAGDSRRDQVLSLSHLLILPSSNKELEFHDHTTARYGDCN